MSQVLTDPLDRLIAGRVRLLRDFTFYGALAAKLQLVVIGGESDQVGVENLEKPDDESNPWLQFYAGTDGRHLYVNLDKISELSDAEIDFLLAHEVAHCVYRHVDFRDGRHHQIWNQANDYVINLELVDAGIGKLIERPNFKPCCDTKYRGMVSGEVYEELMKNVKVINIGINGNAELENGNTDQSFDRHFDIEVDDDPEEAKKNGYKPLTSKEKKAIADELRQTISQVYESQKNAGNIPAGMKRLLDELHDPKLDWRDYLEITANAITRDDHTFIRPSRKSWSTNFILPGLYSESGKVDLAIALDMSGSIGQAEAIDFLSEVKGIMGQFADFKVIVWCFDTSVYNKKVFTPENIEEFDDYEIKGGGGTSFECNWEFMEKEEIEPEQFVMFTDGYPNGTWGDDSYCDTIFLIHDNIHIKAPFGVSIHYEKEKKK